MSGLVRDIVTELRSNYGEEIEKIKTLKVGEIQQVIDKIKGDEFQTVLQKYKEYLKGKDLKKELKELFKEDPKQSGGAPPPNHRTLHHRNEIRRLGAEFENQFPEISVFICVLIVVVVLLKDLSVNNQNTRVPTAEEIHELLESILGFNGTSNGGRKRVKSNRKSKKQSKSKRKGNRRRSVRYRRRR